MQDLQPINERLQEGNNTPQLPQEQRKKLLDAKGGKLVAPDRKEDAIF